MRQWNSLMIIIGMLIALILIGCGDVEEEVSAYLIDMTPPNGGHLEPNGTLIMIFDAPPGTVTVNGTPAVVTGKTVTWDATNLAFGPTTLKIQWDNGAGGNRGQATLDFVVRMPCPPPKDHLITGIEVHPVERTIVGAKTFDQYSDRLTYWIRFDVITKSEIVGETPVGLRPQSSDCNPGNILNPTVMSQSQISLDKPIKFKGETVPANTNLLESQEFDGSTFNVFMPPLTPFVIGNAVITRDFELPPDTYTVFFKWSTIEGEIFSDTVKVYIDVDLP